MQKWGTASPWPSLLPRLSRLLQRWRVKRWLHARFHAFLRQCLLVLLPKERILEPVGNRGTAFRDVYCTLVGVLLAGYTCPVLAMIVGPVPSDQTQRLLTDSEMGMEPVSAIRRSRDHSDRLIILPEHLIGLSVFPGCHAQGAGPSVRVSLALQ